MPMTRVGVAVGATLLVVALGGCASQADVADDEPVTTNQVDMPRSYRFEPEAIQIEAGTTVTWTNNDNFTHDVVLLEPEEIDIGVVEPGEQVTYTFEKRRHIPLSVLFSPATDAGCRPRHQPRVTQVSAALISWLADGRVPVSRLTPAASSPRGAGGVRCDRRPGRHGCHPGRAWGSRR